MQQEEFLLINLSLPHIHQVSNVPVEEKKESQLFNIDESLENLELFKATNLGRLLQNNPINKDLD
jgi:hypothetical protein